MEDCEGLVAEEAADRQAALLQRARHLLVDRLIVEADPGGSRRTPLFAFVRS